MACARLRVAASVLITAALYMAVTSKEAKAAWSDIACGQSDVFVTEAVRCRIDAMSYTGNPSANAGSRKHFVTFGTHEGSKFLLFLQSAKPPAFFNTYTTAAAADSIKLTVADALKPQPTAWGATYADSAMTAISFTYDGENCIGFDYAGPPDPSTPYGNHAWLLRGYLCPTREHTATPETLKRFLAAIRLGPPEKRLNVFGKSVEVWPSGTGQASAGPSNPLPQPNRNLQTAPPRTDTGETSGSGFFVSASGHVLTNNHVVRDCRRIMVRQNDGVGATAQIVSRSVSDDLALLHTTSRPTSVASFRGGRTARQGNRVVVFGFPLAGALSSAGNLTTGDIAALAGLRDDARIYQISAPVQPGNSGGPVLDLAGNVVGVVMSKLDAIRVANVTGDVPQNVNFAIKSSVATNFLDAAGIDYQQGPSSRDLSVEAVGDRARRFTVRIICQR